MPTLPAPEARSAPALPRTARRRGPWTVLAIAAAAVGVAFLFLADLFRREAEVPADSEPASVAHPYGGALRGTEPRRKTVPRDAVDVVVVTQERGDPVEGVEVRLRPVLSSRPAAAVERTGAEGRARLTGPLPGFVEVLSDSWAADPPVREALGGTEMRVEVSPRAPCRATLLDAQTGLALGAWWLGAAGAEPARTDGQGTVVWPGRGGLPRLLAASDGRRRIHAFVLHEVPGRAEARLAVPPATRNVRVRAVDPEGRPVAGARLQVPAEGTGVGIDLDDGGEADVEFDDRAGLSVALSAPGRVRRRVRLDGPAEVVTVVLEAAGPRAFRVRGADGTPAPDGTEVQGWTRGPRSYGEAGPGLAFEGRVEGGTAVVPDLPLGAFDATVEARGPGVFALRTVLAGDDPTAPVEVLAAAPRPLALRVVRAGGEGEAAVPVEDLLRVEGPSPGNCQAAPAAAWAAIDAAVRGGRADAADPIALHAGPDLAVEVPGADMVLRLRIASRDGSMACVEIAPGDGPGAREVALAATGAALLPPPTWILVEWEDGAPASMTLLRVRRDGSDGPVPDLLTDSTGMAPLDAREGRFTFHAVRSDGVAHASDGPLLLPAPGLSLVRLVPEAR